MKCKHIMVSISSQQAENTMSIFKWSPRPQPFVGALSRLQRIARPSVERAQSNEMHKINCPWTAPAKISKHCTGTMICTGPPTRLHQTILEGKTHSVSRNQNQPLHA